MQIVYFSQKEQFLTEMETMTEDLVFVAPSPAKADGLRSRLSGSNSHDVITIAKFTSNLIGELWDGEDKPEVKRKSELLLIFGILKNKYLPELGYEQFTQAYNLFSDLRSFTLNKEALTSVLDEQPEMIKKAVELFWQLLDLTGYLDEHGAYQQIAERLRSSDESEKLKKVYVFWGFQHLNGQQVDLLKAISIRYQVVIPFPFALKEKLKKSDWLSWVKDHKTDEVVLPEIPQEPRASWISINSREISLHLKSHLKKGDQVVLGVSKLTPSHIDIVPSQEVRFKIPHELLTTELLSVADTLKKFTGTSIELLQLVMNGMKAAPSLKYFRAWQLYQEALASITELSDEVITCDRFFLKLLFDVVGLNQPRTSFVPVSRSELNIDLKDMSQLENLDRKRRVLLCIDERFEDIQGLGQNYTESIQKALASLGPLKRNELELLFKQWEFRDLFSSGNVLLFMNEGTLKHSLVWKRLFKDITLIPEEKTNTRPDRKVSDYFATLSKKSFSGGFSASKLQTFMDCPRRFYFNYVDKVFPNIQLEKDFDPMTSGTIIHEIIEKFFKENWKDEELGKLTSQIMNIYIKEKNLVLPKEVQVQRELIFNHRAMNGIQFIRNVETATKEKIEWKIEEDFKLTEPFIMNGRIDCMGISSKYLFLLDFKSTEYSASSNKEVTEIEAIQLWAYAHAAGKMLNDFAQKTVVLGYVVLDDPSKSNLLTEDEDLAKALKGICKSQKLKENFSEKLKEAQDKMTNLTLAIAAEKNFLAKPRKPGTCDFCELNKVCVKSEMGHVTVS